MLTKTHKIMLAIGIPVLILAILSVTGLTYYRQLTNSRAGMTPMKTQQVFDDTYVFRAAWYNNFWIIKTECGLVAFDSGLYPEKTVSEMKKLGFKPSQVIAAFLTHSDEEHAGGVGNFKNAKVYLAEEEVQMLDGTTSRVPWPLSNIYYNKIDVPYTTMEDGEEVEVCGLNVRGVLVPGHTPGSMVYTVGDKMFTGDTMGLIDGKVVAFNKYLFVNMDNDQLTRSIPIMARLKGIKHVLTMHYGMSDDFEYVFAGWK